MSIQVVAFDVNETLLDLSALDESFERLFGDAAVRGQWFSQMLQLSLVGGLSGEYVDFGTAQEAALRMLAKRLGVEVAEDDVRSVVDGMQSLPPHEEVPKALATLKDAGMTLCALTNSTLSVARAQVAGSGLDDVFAEVLSADTVRALKPAPAPYRHVADTFGVSVEQVRLVAAHSWDVSGALAAGCAAAFVARPGAVLSPLGRQPDIVGEDLDRVVDRIISFDLG